MKPMYKNVKLAGPYGNVVISDTGVTIEADSGQLYRWSHRSGSVWPCSHLDELESVSATFDTNGLLDLEQDPAYDEETGLGEVPGDEFSAWSSDVLAEVLPADHPCYYVTVGQFRGSYAV